jgi:heme oxygenase
MNFGTRSSQDTLFAGPAREYLRHATAHHHARIERVLNLETIGCPADYRQLLARMLAFYRPMELALARIAWDAFELNHAERRKTPLLIRDLLAIGLTRQEIVAVPEAAIPDFDGHAGALGCCYVLEGATLGGQLIARHVKSVLRFDSENGASFFNGYGRATGAMWSSFCKVLNARIQDSSSYRTAAAAACATFEHLEACLRCPGEAGARMAATST